MSHPPKKLALSPSLFGKRPLWTIFRLILILAVLFFVSRLVFTPTVITGTSMAPTLEHGEVKVVNRLAYLRTDPDRGDIVVAAVNGEMVAKRIVGLPGETILIVGGVLLIDGEPHPEPYVEHAIGWTIPPVELEEEEYLIIGDNRGMPPEAHAFGVVHRNQILGRLWFSN